MVILQAVCNLLMKSISSTPLVALVAQLMDSIPIGESETSKLKLDSPLLPD